jgi:hypothetical protein
MSAGPNERRRDEKRARREQRMALGAWVRRLPIACSGSGTVSTQPAGRSPKAACQSSAGLPSSHILTIFGSKRPMTSTRSDCEAMT